MDKITTKEKIAIRILLFIASEFCGYSYKEDFKELASDIRKVLATAKED